MCKKLAMGRFLVLGLMIPLMAGCAVAEAVLGEKGILAAAFPMSEGGPGGGTAYSPQWAEKHCQKYGKHAAITGALAPNSTGHQEVTFQCVQ